jgi:hypothetical protein
VHKIDGPQQDLDKQRMWRWALRGIVIQWKSGNIEWMKECLLFTY